MRRIVVAAAIVAGVALAPRDAAAAGDRIGLGGDAQLVVPVGDYADVTGPQIGLLARAGYRVVPRLEIAARIGYLYGLDKDADVGPGVKVKRGISVLPAWLGGRVFFMEPPAGLYLSFELALAFLFTHAPKASGPKSGPSGATVTLNDASDHARLGANVGLGYVISRDVPVDLRVQLMVVNLAPRDTGEGTYLGLGFSGGYTFFF